jgi:hypothetical protein
MDESKVRELLMVLKIYLKYESSDGKVERQNLRNQLKKMVEELLGE